MDSCLAFMDYKLSEIANIDKSMSELEATYRTTLADVAADRSHILIMGQGED